MSRVVYIDGFNLYFGIRELKRRDLYWLDVVALARRIVPPGDRVERVRYFSARIKAPEEKRERQSDYLDALSTLPSIDIEFGQYRSDRKQCRACGAPWIRHEEKMTDVNIAIRMLADAIEGVGDAITLVSADSDLQPAVREIRRLFPARHVQYAPPPCRNSEELRKIAHARRKIKQRDLERCQLPDPVVGPSGFELQCPSTWA
jgi:uncharacterized LabA/DUF88 family protein